MDSLNKSQPSVSAPPAQHYDDQSESSDLSKPTPKTQPQRYQYICIVDFEASISESDGKHEMTEFPLILLSTATPSLKVIDEFHTFIRPQRNTKFKAPKDIPQHVFEESPTFPQAWHDLLQFLARHGVTESNALAITCGDWDFRAMLPTEQTLYGIKPIPLFENWCNIKHAFTAFTGKKADSMVRMLNIIGQPLVGTHHSGIDDARNIAGIARWLCDQGHVFKITSDGSVDEDALARQGVLRLEKEEKTRTTEKARIDKLGAGAIPPDQMFRTDESFAEWDEDGIPLRMVDGTILSKSAINKKRKVWRAQKVLHEKYLAWKQTEGESEKG